MKRELHPTSAFLRSLKRIAKKDRPAFLAIGATLPVLRENAFDPRLGTHKLKGNLDGLWACSAGYDLRIVFEIVKAAEAEIILLVSVGAHDEVY